MTCIISDRAEKHPTTVIVHVLREVLCKIFETLARAGNCHWQQYEEQSQPHKRLQRSLALACHFSCSNLSGKKLHTCSTPPETPLICNHIAVQILLMSSNRSHAFQTSFDGYSTEVSFKKLSLIALMLTNLDSKFAEPALSFVPDALAPPNGCCATTAPVLLQLR